MNTALTICKALLKLVWALIKITVWVADAAIDVSNHHRKTPRYNELEAIELLQNAAISPQDYTEATRQ